MTKLTTNFSLNLNTNSALHSTAQTHAKNIESPSNLGILGIKAKNLKSAQSLNNPNNRIFQANYQSTNVNEFSSILDQTTKSDNTQDFFSSIKNIIQDTNLLISKLNNQLDEEITKKPVDKDKITILYTKINNLHSELNNKLNNIYKDSQINQAICNSIFKDDMQKLHNSTSDALEKCSQFVDTGKISQTVDINNVIKELDSDIKSHQQANQELLTKLDLKNIPEPAKQHVQQLHTYAQHLLKTPPNLELSKHASYDDKIAYTKAKLEYALQLKDVYEGLAKIDEIKTKNPNELQHQDINSQIQKACEQILNEKNIRHNLHNLKPQNINHHSLDNNNHQYKKYLTQAILNNISIKQTYDNRYNLHFWKQTDRQSCVFASICNSLQLSSIDELDKYLRTKIETKTLETWLLELLDSKIGVSINEGFSGSYLHNSSIKPQLNSQNIIGMYTHNDKTTGGHVVSVINKNDKFYLMNSGAKSIQEFNHQDDVFHHLNQQYGNRYNKVGESDANHSTVLFNIQ
ncbi:MAG: hypothetical protein RLZZ210_1148 [Pseudomonadota bacterium]